MPGNNDTQITPETANAQNEFKIIQDLLMVPENDGELKERRRWKANCLTPPVIIIPPLPDLVPSISPISNGATEIQVTIENQGVGAAAKSKVKWLFPPLEGSINSTIVDQELDRIEPNQSVKISFNIREQLPELLSLSFNFWIIVNFDRSIAESRYDNNIAAGQYPGPVIIK